MFFMGIQSNHNHPRFLVLIARFVISLKTAYWYFTKLWYTIMIFFSEFSGLPPFLVKDGGLNSGFMMVQVSAAALGKDLGFNNWIATDYNTIFIFYSIRKQSYVPSCHHRQYTDQRRPRRPRFYGYFRGPQSFNSCGKCWKR